MFRNKTITIEEAICDICGKPAYKDYQPWFCMRDLNGEICFESRIYGDYCKEHLEALEKSWIEAFNTVVCDRYHLNESDAKRIEVDVIKNIGK